MKKIDKELRKKGFLQIITTLLNITFFSKLLKDYQGFNYLKYNNLDIPVSVDYIDLNYKIEILNNFYLLGYEYIILIALSFFLLLFHISNFTDLFRKIRVLYKQNI